MSAVPDVGTWLSGCPALENYCKTGPMDQGHRGRCYLSIRENFLRTNTFKQWLRWLYKVLCTPCWNPNPRTVICWDILYGQRCWTPQPIKGVRRSKSQMPVMEGSGQKSRRNLRTSPTQTREKPSATITEAQRLILYFLPDLHHQGLAVTPLRHYLLLRGV